MKIKADNDAEWTTIEDAAARYKQSTRTIRRHIAEDILPAYRIGNGKSIRLRVSDVEKLARPIPTA